MAASDLQKVGRFTITRVLGQGAMGVVYEAFDPKLNRQVAIKTILKTHLEQGTAREYSKRFEREAQAVARLNHPNIVQVHDFGEEGDVAYLVMEFIKGQELKTQFDANRRLPLAESVRIVSELCDALDFAHKAGVVHRDVKPGNVMLDAQMRVKLTDFGVARLQDATRSNVTAAGTMVGTPAYMSPEQIRGSAVDGRSDVFSTGIILYQLLTGETPFGGGGPWTIAKKIMQDEPPRPSSVNTSISPAFDAVVNKALAKDPHRRYQTAAEFAVALKAASAGTPLHDLEDTVVQESTTVVQEAAGKEAPADHHAEDRFWRSIKDSTDPRDFEVYLEQFPDGLYAKLARRKISSAGTAQNTQPPAVAAPKEEVGAPRASHVATIFAALAALGIVGALVWFLAFPAAWQSVERDQPKPTPRPVTAKQPDAAATAAAARVAAEKAAAAEAARQAKLAREREEQEKAAAAEAARQAKLAREREEEEKAASAKRAAEEAAAAKRNADKVAKDRERAKQQADREAAARAEAEADERAEAAGRAAAAERERRAAIERAAAAEQAAAAERRAAAERAAEAERQAAAERRRRAAAEAQRQAEWDRAAAEEAARQRANEARRAAEARTDRSNYKAFGRVVEILDNSLAFENHGFADVTVGSVVYVRVGFKLVEFRITSFKGTRTYATAVRGMGDAAKDCEVLYRFR